jgi:CRISPR system Cascade subunit CasE
VYFSRIEPRRDFISVRDIVRMSASDGYIVHKMIWQLFSDGPDRKRDFLYRIHDAKSWPVIYTVSMREPIDTEGGWAIQTKPYHPQLRAEERLGFSLRVNAVNSRRDDEARQHRHDVVQDAKARLKLKGETPSMPLAVLAWQEGTAWLTARAGKHGFSIDTENVRLDGYRRHDFVRKAKKVTINTLDFSGLLTVTDPDAFRQTLFTGIGPAKGFGCGMIMVKRLQ